MPNERFGIQYSILTFFFFFFPQQIWRLENPTGSKCHVLHTIKFQTPIGACAFSPDASLMCIGTYGGILKVYEAESGVMVQTFKDNIKSGVPRNSTIGASESSKIVKITVVKETSSDDAASTSSNLSEVGSGLKSTLTFGLLGGKGNANSLKNSASYNNDLVVYVHELKKPAMCHVLVRDIISGALMHAYDVAEVTSCFAIWASKLSVILAGKPKPMPNQPHADWALQPEMALAVRDLDLSAIQHSLVHKGGHREDIVCASVSNDGARIGVGAKSGRISIYQCEPNQQVATATMAIPAEGSVKDLAFTPTNALLLMACGVESFESSNNKLKRQQTGRNQNGYVCCYDSTNNGKKGKATTLWRVKLPLPAMW